MQWTFVCVCVADGRRIKMVYVFTAASYPYWISYWFKQATTLIIWWILKIEYMKVMYVAWSPLTIVNVTVLATSTYLSIVTKTFELAMWTKVSVIKLFTSNLSRRGSSTGPGQVLRVRAQSGYYVLGDFLSWLKRGRLVIAADCPCWGELHGVEIQATFRRWSKWFSSCIKHVQCRRMHSKEKWAVVHGVLKLLAH